MKKEKKYLITIVGIALFLIVGIELIVRPTLQGRFVLSQVNGTKLEIEKVAVAVNKFHDLCGRYPTEFEGLLILTRPDLECPDWTEPILDSIPKDSWGQELAYSYAGPGNTFDITSKGADKQVGGDGYDRDIRYQDLK